MLLKVCPGSWYCLNILHLGIRYHPKQKIKNGSKQIIKHLTSNVHYRIFMKISQISRFADLLLSGLHKINSPIYTNAQPLTATDLGGVRKGRTHPLNSEQQEYIFLLFLLITSWAKLPTNCLSVFDHFVGLALKGLKFLQTLIKMCFLIFSIFNNCFIIVHVLHLSVSFLQEK